MGRKSKEQLEKEDMKQFKELEGFKRDTTDYSHISNKLMKVRRQIKILQTKEKMLVELREKTSISHNKYMVEYRKKRKMEKLRKGKDGQVSKSTKTP